VQSFNYITDSLLADVADDLVDVPARAGRADVLRGARLRHDPELLDALDGAEVDRNAIIIALADTGRILPLRVALAVIEDQERDRRIELARAS